MTPTEHYAEAERILGEVAARMNELVSRGPVVADDLALVSAATQSAQIHATLATIDPERLWPRQWIVGNRISEALCAGVVTETGIGEVRIMVASDTRRYPEVGEHVTVLSIPGPPPLDPMCTCGHPASMHDVIAGSLSLGPCLSSDPSDTCTSFEAAP